MRKLLPLLLLAGCALKPEIVQLDPTPRSPTTPEVLAEEPRREYKTIALIRVAPAAGEGVNKLTERVVLEAGKLGGDAVILGFEDEGSSVFIPSGAALIEVPLGNRIVTGKVIVWTGS